MSPHRQLRISLVENWGKVPVHSIAWHMQSPKCLRGKGELAIIKTIKLDIYGPWSINVLEKDNERISMINYHFNAKYKTWRIFWAVYTEIFIHCSLKAEKKLRKHQVQSLIVRIITIKKMLSHQLQQIYYIKVKALIEMRRVSALERNIWLEALENIESLNSLRSS